MVDIAYGSEVSAVLPLTKVTILVKLALINLN
jgi:hypothetical protein